MINQTQRIEAIRDRIAVQASRFGVCYETKVAAQKGATDYFKRDSNSAHRAIVEGEKLLRGLQ